MINTTSSSSTNSYSILTFGLGVGLSLFPSNTSAEIETSELSSESLTTIERNYNTPMDFGTDQYIEETYKVDFFEQPIYDSPDFSFLSMTQKFAEEQVSLEDDFVDALDELLSKNLNKLPKKTRF